MPAIWWLMSSGWTFSPSRLLGRPGVASPATLVPATAAGFGLLPQPANNVVAAATTAVARIVSGRIRVMISPGGHVQRRGRVRTGPVDDRNIARRVRDVGPRSAGGDIGRLELHWRPLAALDR